MIPAIGLVVAAIGIVVCLYVLPALAWLAKQEAGAGVSLLFVLAAPGSPGGIVALLLLAMGLNAAGSDVAGVLGGAVQPALPINDET